MQLEQDNFKQYLSALQIPVEQKRYAMNFCKKIKYLDELHNIAAKEVNECVNVGYGNVNSKICLLFKDKKSYLNNKSLIEKLLEKYDINIWNVYITFVNKTEMEYGKKYSYLIHELYAINPSVLYVFDDNNAIYTNTIHSFPSFNINYPDKHFFIDINKLISNNENERKELWNMLKYLINYK